MEISLIITNIQQHTYFSFFLCFLLHMTPSTISIVIASIIQIIIGTLISNTGKSLSVQLHLNNVKTSSYYTSLLIKI